MTILKLLPVVALATTASAQFFQQNFDSVSPPALPQGWTTSQNRSPAGDFVSASSSPRSDPNAVLSLNATIPQTLLSPELDFTILEPESLKFFERRSASHNSSLLVEALTPEGSTFLLSDSLKNPGSTAYIQRKLKVPSSLGGAPRVRFRWRTAGDGTGSSGTLRIDDVMLSCRAYLDASILEMSFSPFAPAAGDTVSIRVVVENAGLRPLGGFGLEFFEDTNGDGLPEEEERFFSVIIPGPLAPASSLEVCAHTFCGARGIRSFIARTLLAGDQNPSNDMARGSLVVGLRAQSVVVNEIMYAPLSPEPEWIELLNRSGEVADIRNWKLSNRNTLIRYTIPAGGEEVLPPGAYCLVTRDSALLRSLRPEIPSPVVQAPGLPSYLWNNNGDAVILWDERGLAMDSLRYEPGWGGTKGGYSLERRDPDSSSLSAANWGSCSDPAGATAGRMNSLTPFDEDLALLPIGWSLAPPPRAQVLVLNTGRKGASGITLSLYDDADKDSVGQSDELSDRREIAGILLPHDSLLVQLEWRDSSPGRHSSIVVLDYGKDMRPSDNVIFSEVRFPYPPGTLVINEFMYEPLPGNCQYIEVLNTGRDQVDLSGWRLSDIGAPGPWPESRTICTSAASLDAGGYTVVAADSSIYSRYPELADSLYHSTVRPGALGLKSSGDRIILTDPTGITSDSLSYTPAWHTPGIEEPRGRSLERINPRLPGSDRRNWGTSADASGGTPGRRNSLWTDSAPQEASLGAQPDPFSPDGDGHEDVTLIHWRLPFATPALRVRILDACGRLVRTVSDGEPAPALGELVWDGYRDDGMRARMGIYIILLEAVDPRTGGCQTLKCAVVVAARL